MDAILDVPTSAARHVAVAIDAAGAGGNRRYTYVVPPELADLEPGEAVLVEFGRRRAIAVVLGDAPPPDGITAKPIEARVRTDGPLLPPLALRLADWIADHYLAPPAVVVRSMLPPGFLERLELLAERTTTDAPDDLTPADRDLLDQLARQPRPVRDLVSVEGRAGLLRRIRVLADRGLATLDWTLLSAGVGPRYERFVRLTADGRRAAASPGEMTGRPLGPRQGAALEELLREAIEPGSPGVAAAPLGDRHGSSTILSLARRGLVEVEVRERPRRPLAARPPGLRGTRPAGAELDRRPGRGRQPRPCRRRGGRPAPDPPRRRHRQRQDRDLRRRDRRLPRTRPAGPRRRPGDRARPAPRGPAPGRPRRAGRPRPLGARGRRARGRVAADPERRRRRRRRHAAGGDRAAGRRRAGRRRRGARRRLQVGPDAPSPGPRHGDRPRGAGRRGGRPRQRHAVGRVRRPGARGPLRAGRPAAPPERRAARRSRSSTSARS